MKTAFRKSFAKDLRQIHDKDILNQVQKIISEIEEFKNIREIQDLKKLSRETRHYRLKLGDYRIGLIIEGQTVTFIRILHRREIYRYFP